MLGPARRDHLWLEPQGAADRLRLRRITAAPCPFGSASVADSWARAWPSYLASCSPSRFGKTSGNAWGSKKRRGSCLRGHLGRIGGLLGRLGALLGRFGALLEASWAVLERREALFFFFFCELN